MNEFTLNTAAMAAAAAAASGVNSTGAATSIPAFTQSQSQGPYMHESTSSFQSYISSTPTNPNGSIGFSSTLNSLMSPGTSPTDRGTGQRSNRIRRITNLSSIFTTNSNNTLTPNAAAVAAAALAGQAQAKSTLNEILSNYSKELPPLSEKLNLKAYDPSILEIESKWNVFVGDAFVQVSQLTSHKIRSLSFI